MPRHLCQFLASSAPSDVSTVHTIASTSSLRPLVSTLRKRDVRPPRPLLGDVIATTSPNLAADRPTTSSRAAPRRSAILPASSSSPSHPSGGEEGKSKGANRTGRERTRAKDAADIFARSSLPSSSAVPVILRPDLVRSLSSVRPSVFLFLVPRSPSCRLTAKPTPAAHYLTRSHPRQSGKGSPRPVLVVIPSPPPRHRPATETGIPLPDLLPASPSPSGRW